MLSFYRLLLSNLLLVTAQPVFASTLMGESIYFLELLVIAIVAVALILVTSSIAKSKNTVKKAALDIREEMSQEHTMLQMAMNRMKEKEKQISYMAHLLQEHLEKGAETVMVSGQSKKKVNEELDELIVEVLDEVDEQSVASAVQKKPEPRTATHHVRARNNKASSRPIDPRKVSADGSIKQANFGPNQYLADIQAYQQQMQVHVQELIVQNNTDLSSCVENLHREMSKVQSEREKLSDFVVAIESNISPNATQNMNEKDRKIVRSLNNVDQQLHILERKQQSLIKRYSQSILRFEDYISVDEAMSAEVED